MINVNDLMVGNWIYVSSPEDRENTRRLYYIDEVYRDCIRVEDCEDFFEDIYLESIPVTEDMLKRIGFEEYEDSLLERSFYRYWDKDYKYKLEVYPYFCNSDRKFSIHIDNEYCETIGSGEFTYLHELQNLVRINCRADLPITKEMIDGNIDE